MRGDTAVDPDDKTLDEVVASLHLHTRHACQWRQLARSDNEQGPNGGTREAAA